MIRILNELSPFCENCPYMNLTECERLGSGVYAYTCNHLGKCSRVYRIAKENKSEESEDK